MYITVNMPMEVSETVNYIADRLLAAEALGRVFKNTLYVALLTAFAIVMIVLWVYRHIDSDESRLTLALRTGFASLIVLSVVFFLYNKVAMAETAMSSKSAVLENVFGGSSSSFEDSIVPVTINTDFD